jgi:hypothetical protein
MRTTQAIQAATTVAATQHGVLHRTQARSAGLGPKQVHRLLDMHVLTEPFPGVLVVSGSPYTWHQRLCAATLSGARRPVAAVRSGAALHRLDGYPPGPLELAVPAGGKRPVLDGVTVHRSVAVTERHIVVVDGIRTTNIAATLADLGSVDDPERVLMALDSARRRGVSVSWLRAVADELHRPGQRGTGVLRGLLDEAVRRPVVPASWLERLLALCLEHPSLPPVVRQHTIRCSSTGRFLARVDLAIPSLRLGIEGHSRQFHFGAAQERRDADRDLAVAAELWDLLYLGYHDAMQPQEALSKVLRVANARAALLPALSGGSSSLARTGT